MIKFCKKFVLRVHLDSVNVSLLVKNKKSQKNEIDALDEASSL